MRHRRAGLALAATITLGALGGLVQPAGATSGALSQVSWSASNTQVGATGSTYTFQFTTGTTGTISSVTTTVPVDTAGTLSGVVNYGIGAGTATLSGGTLTYAVTTPATVASGTQVSIAVGGLTNTATAQSFASTIATNTDAGVLDSYSGTDGVASTLAFGAGATDVTAVVAKSLLFSNDTPPGGFTWQLDPAVNTTASSAVHLSVKTNAGQGYSLAVDDTGLRAGSYQIGAAPSGGTATAPPANAFGYSASLTGGGNSLAAVQPVGLSGGKYIGYTDAGSPTTVVSASKPTGNSGDSVTITNAMTVDYSAPAGTYTDTINYVVTPTY